MRVSNWVGASLMTAVATVAVVGFIDAASMNGAPSASECVNDWNARAGQGEQKQVAAEDYRTANVQGWFTDVSSGCGIWFAAPEGMPLLSCTRPFDASDPQPTEWSCELDSPVPGLASSMDPAGVAKIVSGWQVTLGD